MKRRSNRRRIKRIKLHWQIKYDAWKRTARVYRDAGKPDLEMVALSQAGLCKAAADAIQD